MMGILEWLDSVTLDELRAEIQDVGRQQERLQAKLRLLQEAMEVKRLDEFTPRTAPQMSFLAASATSAEEAAGLPFPASGPPPLPRPKTIRGALQVVFDENRHRVWTVAGLTAEIEERGWLAGKQTGAVGVALVRMSKEGEVTRIRKGSYVGTVEPRPVESVDLEDPVPPIPEGAGATADAQASIHD